MESKNKKAAATKTIENENVQRVLRGLTDIGDLDIVDFKLNWNISKNITKLSQVEKSYLKSLNAIKKKYIKMDDKGQFVIENKAYVFSSSKDAESYTTETETLNSQVVEIDLVLIKGSELSEIKGIKANMIAMCEELIIDDVK